MTAIGHIVTKYFLFFALLLWYTLSIVDHTIRKTRHKRCYTLPISLFIIATLVSYDIFQAYLVIGLSNWIRDTVNEFTQYYTYEILHFTQTLSNIGIGLIPFERNIIYFNYFILLMYLFILLITINVAEYPNVKKICKNLVGTMLILFYFGALFGRFLPSHPRHALMRFSPWILLIFMLYIILNYKNTLNISGHKHYSIKMRSIILIMSILMLISTFLNLIAQNSPILKYTMQLGDPRISTNFVENYIISDEFVFGYFAEKAYDYPSLWSSLVDSHLVHVKHKIRWFLPGASISMHNVLLVEGLKNPLIRFYLQQNTIYNDCIYGIFTPRY